MKRTVHSIVPLIGLVLFVVALIVLRRELGEYRYQDVARHLKELPLSSILLAFALSTADYLLLFGYDTLALHYIGHPLPFRKIGLVSFITYAFSHNIGLAGLSGSSVRYRLYSAWGYSALEITMVVAFCGLSFWLGFLTLAGVIFLIEPLAIPTVLHLPFASVRPLGAIFLVVIGVWFLWSVVQRSPLKVRNWAFRLPSTRMLLAQLVVASLDWTLVGSILYVLLPQGSSVRFTEFLGMFLLAQVAGIASQVPGGLGVFETVVLFLLGPSFSAASLFGSLLVFRAAYYLLPLAVAAVLLGAHEILDKRESVKRFAAIFGQWVPGLIPHLFAVTTFVGGAVLLFSGAMPSVGWRLAWLKDFLPLPVMEVSHFLGSLVGVMLLLLAWGLRRRLDAAYVLTVVLLSAGIVLSLLKGLDYEEAVILLVMLGALLPCRKSFYRKATLFSERFTAGWIVAIFLVLVACVWLVFFSYRHLEYASDVWWRFTLEDNVARSLRATVGVSVALLVFAATRLLRPSQPEPGVPTATDLDRASAIVEQCPRTSACLAFLGDKAFLFGDKGNAFILYAIEGRSWVALGDPVGPQNEWAELVWRYRELCDRHDGWTVFYQVGPAALHLYLDLGLTLLKIGEEGRVSLETFLLEGGSRKGLRQTCHRVENEGCAFEIIPRKEVPAFLPEFKHISDAWLAGKNTREKRFSVGFFDPEYLSRFDAAVVRKEGKIVAFANVLPGAKKEELSLDLMRFLPEIHLGVMDYLFTNLMLWGKHEGYKWFNLGMAPLSGLENRALAPFWNRLGAFIFAHGEHFYNFQGLRQYKEKFDPQWTPKYLATPGGLALPRILTNLASLISGGLKGIVAK